MPQQTKQDDGASAGGAGGGAEWEEEEEDIDPTSTAEGDETGTEYTEDDGEGEESEEEYPLTAEMARHAAGKRKLAGGEGEVGGWVLDGVVGWLGGGRRC